MSQKITLRNTDRSSEYQIFAADGSSFQIQPGAVVPNVDPKFDWDLPPKVQIIGGRTVAVSSQTQTPNFPATDAVPTSPGVRTRS